MNVRPSLSFKLKFILFVSIFITVLIAFIAIMFARININSAIAIFGESGVPIVRTAQSIIDGDEFEKFSETKDENDPYYEETRLKLLEIKQTSNCRFLYTMQQKDGKEFYYIIDGSCDPSDEENFSPLGTVEDITSYGEYPFLAMVNKEITISRVEKQEDWGWTITVYAPIINSQGISVGFIGCDFDVHDMMSMIQKSITQLAITCTIVVILLIVAIVLFMSPFFKRINAVIDAMGAISQGEGDLTMRLKVNKLDEVGRLSESCNALTEKLCSIISSLKTSVESLSDTGKSLHTQTQETIATVDSANENIELINDQAKDQSETMNEVFSSVSQVESEIKGLDEKLAMQSSEIKSSSDTIKNLTNRITDMAANLSEVVTEQNKLVALTKDGKNIQENVQIKMNAIVEETKNLSVANAAITDIASQTNLLAMNAAIEAAHAGETGKGFAVVANEIRSLAETSAKQSNAISDLIEKIDESVKEVVNATSLSTNSFSEIGEQVSHIDNFMNEINKKMQEQHESANAILGTMTEINSSTNDIATGNTKMKDESSKLFSGIDNLREKTSSILKTVDEANESLKHIHETAKINEEAARKNLLVSSEVNEMVNKFKTE